MHAFFFMGDRTFTQRMGPPRTQKVIRELIPATLFPIVTDEGGPLHEWKIRDMGGPSILGGCCMHCWMGMSRCVAQTHLNHQVIHRLLVLAAELCECGKSERGACMHVQAM